MKLTEWARRGGVHPKTASRWFHRGVLPVPARQLPTGTILVELAPHSPLDGVALYARVSSWDQKADLARQRGRLSAWATQHGLRVVEAGETRDDLVCDMGDVLTSFCARLYGRRGARTRARRGLPAANASPQRPRRGKA